MLLGFFLFHLPFQNGMVTKDLTRLKTLLKETEVRLFQPISLGRV